MHQQAILVSGSVTFAVPGAPVSIEDVEKHFGTTTAANAGMAYQCADSNCGVPVMAVITKPTKVGRKSSPGSYFRSKSSNPHKSGCTRQPVSPSTLSGSSATTVSPASPNRTTAPAVWVDPSSTVIGSPASVGAAGSSGSSSPGRRFTKGAGGSRTSQGSSQRVEAFAKYWLKMNAQAQKSAPLSAPWNPQGTYYSAFHVLAYHAAVDVLTVGQKIYVGMLKQVAKTGSDYVIALQEVNSDGRSLAVGVLSSALTVGAPGTALGSRLAALVKAPTITPVFVFGAFSTLANGPLMLSVTHPHCIYIA